MDKYAFEWSQQVSGSRHSNDYDPTSPSAHLHNPTVRLLIPQIPWMGRPLQEQDVIIAVKTTGKFHEERLSVLRVSAY